jgi:ABC-type uncharacterized transport system involved in gliding motility auxiliary subunit
MATLIDKTRSAARQSMATATERAASYSKSNLAWGGLALAAVTVLAVNLFASTMFRSWKMDVTADGLYTISEGTKRSLAAIDEPIDVKLYFSKRLGDAAPIFARNFERVRTLLDQYRALSGNKLRVTVLDPEPFSDAEDRAVAAGMRGVRLNRDGDTGYFGLAGTNSTDNEATIPFFTPERERFIEYDVTKLIHGLANPKKRAIGLLSTQNLEGGLDPMMGMRGRPQPPQVIMEQIREVFEVRAIQRDATVIPKDIAVLMVVQPDNLPEATLYAIDQFALGGGKVLVFMDPVPEMARGPMGMPMPPQFEGFNRLLKSWGVAFDQGVVAADISKARRVQFGGGRGQVTDYVAWLALDKSAIDQKDPLSGGIERLNLASTGFLAKAEGATTSVQPILQTSAQAMVIGIDKIGPMPDAVGLLRAYKPGGKPLVLAARVSGEARSAFEGAPRPPAAAQEAKPADAAKPDDAAKDGKDAKVEPAKTEAPAGPPHIGSGKINVILVTDTDLLQDQFWVDVRDFLGQQIAVPNASNAAFVIGALENLSGSDALLSLRGRGVTDRPFELVDAIRRTSEQRFRDKEQALTTKLKDVQGQLAKLEQAGDGSVLVTERDRAAIDRFRTDLLTTRRELRDVKLALRQDIDRLDGWLRFANIVGVPLLIGLGAVGFAHWRRRRLQAA